MVIILYHYDSKYFLLQFKDFLIDLRDQMDQMITLMRQTTQKIRLMENVNRRMAKCTMQRMIRSADHLVNVSDDMFKSLLKSKQVLLNLVRRLSIASKDKSIDCSLGAQVATSSCSECIRCTAFGEIEHMTE